ncbi:MAG: FAD-binding oxidoreductase [Candidatus Solibacter usitatus]|nr:FAD-binding oxidoreductase [Candidatus Solibacter usitatus]
MVPQSYLEDASGFQGTADELFVPSTEDELLPILRQAGQSGTPVTIAGAGTGVAGARCAQGGWVISLEKFRHIAIHEGYAVVGAGALLKDVQSAAAAKGQMYAPDPTENSSAIGGNIACNASGSRSFRYGDTRRHIRALRVALMDGTILDLRRGQPAPFEIPAIPMPATSKHSAGYWMRPGMDYLDLFIGSEGTLGVVTEAELQLLPATPHLLTGVIFFPTEESALDAVACWREVDRLRMLEYLDAGSLRLLRPKYDDIPAQAQAGPKYDDIPAQAQAALLIEQELDSEDSPEFDAWDARLSDCPALYEASWFAATAADRERFRRFRHALPEAVNDTVRRGGFLKLGSDYAVPFARNREMMSFYRASLDRSFPGRYVIFGHIGDAHVHVNILPRSAEDFERGKSAMTEFARHAVALGGTVGAEHGLGKRKAHLLELQYTPQQLEAMKSVKRRLDPQWLLGRGTLFKYE